MLKAIQIYNGLRPLRDLRQQKNLKICPEAHREQAQRLQNQTEQPNQQMNEKVGGQ